MDVEIGFTYSFKMNSGEEIIGKVTEVAINSSTAPHYVVEAPLGTGMTQQGVQLMPAMFTTEMDGVSNIYFTAVAMISTPRTEVLDAYRESTTGIKVPNKQILLS